MTERPRTRELLIATVSALRDDGDLAGLLYEPDEPPTPDNRQRAHPTWGGPKGTPGVEVVVEPVASGGEWHGGPRSATTQLQASVIATEAWRDGRGILPMYAIRDRVKEVLESPSLAGVYPVGGGGRESPIETPDNSNRLLLPMTAGVRTHHMTY